ncbi:MAG: hypothetical protein U0165_02860 [Polyangiaceae bacterium]
MGDDGGDFSRRQGGRWLDSDASRAVLAAVDSKRRLRPWLVSLAAVFSALMLVTSESEATVEEQRARLPQPAVCQDPVEGVWLSHQYEPRLLQWYLITLNIRRESPEGTKLVGDIVSHFWDGITKDEQPPPCTVGRLHAQVLMPATGKFENGKLEFNGGPWKPFPHPCDPPARRVIYNPDSFSGTVDPDRQEFQSLHNDGGVSVNIPTVFRRIKCFDPPAPPRIDVEPPPLIPPKRVTGGCSKTK